MNQKKSNALYAQDVNKLTNEELYNLSLELSNKIRCKGIPLPEKLGLTAEGSKSVIHNLNDKNLSDTLQKWEKELDSEISRRSSGKMWYSASSYITANLERFCKCEETVSALCDGVGSFNLSIKKWRGSREARGYMLLAQAALLDGFNNRPCVNVSERISELEKADSEVANFYKLAHKLLGEDNRYLACPLFSENIFHGILISKYDGNRNLVDADKDLLTFFAYHLGRKMEPANLNLYTPVVDGGEFQKYVQNDLIDNADVRPIDKLSTNLIAKPSAGLSPWFILGLRKDRSFPAYSDGTFSRAVGDAVEWCAKMKDEGKKEEAVLTISNALKELLGAKECFFMEYKGSNKFTVGGEVLKSVEDYVYDAVALSAMMGAPCQKTFGNVTVIAIPQYADGKYVGSSVVLKNIDEPPPARNLWRHVLYFCQHVFNSLYASVAVVSDDKYSETIPWNAYVETMPEHKDDVIHVFPPSLSRKPEDIAKYKDNDLSLISTWLVKYIAQFREPFSAMITPTDMLAYHLGEDGAKSFYQASTTTILDLCNRARSSSWGTTVRSIFGEAPRFFKDEDIYIMLLSLHKRDGNFNVYHSGEGELEEADRLACEILAEYSVLKDENYYLSANDHEPISELMRSRIGDSSFVVMPIYAEEEINEWDEGWKRNLGRLVGMFTLALSPDRMQPTQAEWAKWGMFVPRIYQIMLSAKDGGKLAFSTFDKDSVGFMAENRSSDLFRLVL